MQLVSDGLRTKVTMQILEDQEKIQWMGNGEWRLRTPGFSNDPQII